MNWNISKYKILFWVSVQAILTLVFSFTSRLVESAVEDWINSRIAEYFGFTSPTITTVLNFTIQWGLPFIIAALCIWGTWSFARHEQKQAKHHHAKPNPVITELIKIIPTAYVVKSPAKTVSRIIEEEPKPAPTQVELDKLYATDEEGKLIWLRFLPDTIEERDRDALLLILYGYKAIKGVEPVPRANIRASLRRSCCFEPDEKKSVTSIALALTTFTHPTLVDADKLAREMMHVYVSEQVQLSKGGAYQLLPKGEEKALWLARDLIRRA